MPEDQESPIVKESAANGEIFLPQNVSLNIFFTRHAAKEDLGDLNKLRKEIKSSDIVVPEEFGWTQDYLKRMNKIARGDYEEYKEWKEKVSNTNRYPEFTLIIGDAIYFSHSKVVFVDMEREDPRVEQLSSFGGMIKAKILESYDKTLESFEPHFKREALLQRQREEHILKQLGPKLKGVIDPNPKLRAKKPIKAFMILGYEHLYVFERLKELIIPDENGLPKVAKEISSSLMIESPEAQLKNLLKDNREVDPEIKKRILTKLFAKSIIRLLDRYRTDSAFIDSLVENLTDDEVRSMHVDVVRTEQMKFEILRGQSPIWTVIDKQLSKAPRTKVKY